MRNAAGFLLILGNIIVIGIAFIVYFHPVEAMYHAIAWIVGVTALLDSFYILDAIIERQDRALEARRKGGSDGKNA